MIVLQPCDLVLTRGRGLLSRAIRFFETGKGEQRARVNHCAIVTTAGYPWDVQIVEALTTVKEHQLWRYANGRDHVAIYRPTNLTTAEKTKILEAADSYIGKPYGPFKLVLHALDRVIGDRYVFRRLAFMDDRPICSWLVARAYAAAGKTFGTLPGTALSPDDIDDFLQSNPDKYACVWPLGDLRDAATEEAAA